MPALRIVPARACSSRTVLAGPADLKYAASQLPPDGLRHVPEAKVATFADSAAFACAPTGPTSLAGAAMTVMVRMRTPSLSRICNEAWNFDLGWTLLRPYSSQN